MFFHPSCYQFFVVIWKSDEKLGFNWIKFHSLTVTFVICFSQFVFSGRSLDVFALDILPTKYLTKLWIIDFRCCQYWLYTMHDHYNINYLFGIYEISCCSLRFCVDYFFIKLNLNTYGVIFYYTLTFKNPRFFTLLLFAD